MEGKEKRSSGDQRGKSWKREREERGRRLLQQVKGTPEGGGATCPTEADDTMPLRRDSESSTEAIPDKAVSEENLTQSEESSSSNNKSEETNEVDVRIEEKPNMEEVDETSKKEVEEQERMVLEAYITDIKDKLKFKEELRSTNLEASSNRPEEKFFSRLDSNLKKNTAFVKRLRNITEAQRDSLIKDMNTLNLTKYISEAASAIVEAKLKISDVSTAVQICSLLHQRYADFTPQLLENWQKVLPSKKDDKVTNPSKLRVDLRFYAELISCGVFTLKEGLPFLGNLLTLLTTGDKEEHQNLSVLLSFCRHCGEDYAGILPRKIRLLARKYARDVPRSQLLPPDRQKGLRTLLKEYYKSLCRHLVKDHKLLQTMDRQNRRTLQTKGELGNERRDRYETAHLAFQKLFSSTQQFSDILDEDLPDLPKDENASSDSESTSLDVHNRFRDGELDLSSSLWEDDDTRCFYETLPDLKSLVPGILFKDSLQAVPVASIAQSEELKAGLEDEELNKLYLEELEASTVEAETAAAAATILDETEEMLELLEDPLLEEEKVAPATESTEEGAGVGATAEGDLTEALLQEILDEPEEDSSIPTGGSSSNKILLDSFLSSLLNCVNREMIDKAAMEFCMNLNTKPNRKKLVKSLFLVPRTRLDLLPFYARFVAILNPCMADVANDLVSMLKQDIKFHIKKKDQINIESKVKTVRFIGELVKFRIFPKNEALYCLKLLLFDFSHHLIEMACNLLETCGRFLFRSLDSHQRTKVYLDQMMRKKCVMAVDSRYITMIENAFYYCNPPEAPLSVKIERPPLHEYIRKLLYKDLSKNNTEKILRQMRKLNWDDGEVSAYATKCLTAIWNVKFYNIRCMANLLAGLVAYQETVGPHVVDGVLEDIRLGMEVNHPKFNQRRVSVVRYLGELYNYRMVESLVIFKVLYSFISFGVTMDGTYSELDPMDNLFRLRLVCTLLETCGQYFNSGSSKKKLDCFLIFFQRYFWHKKTSVLFDEDYPFPVSVDFIVKDTLNALRPKLKLPVSKDEAEKATEELLEELKPKLLDFFQFNQDGSQEDFSQDNDTGPTTQDTPGLHPIQELEEEDDEDDETEAEVFSGSQSQPLEEDGEGEGGTQEEPLPSGSLSQEDDPSQIGEEEGTGGDDQQVVLLAPNRHLQCPEDDDFMAAFDKMLSESIMHRTQEPVKPQVDIVIPMNIKAGLLKRTAVGEKMVTSYLPEAKAEPTSTINFILMTRKGNKQQFKNLEVPTTSELAQNLKDREKAERAEKEQVKKLTLNINERQEEEDYQEMLASQQRPFVMNLNRDRRHKYQHPKGAPDADLIFGNK